MFKSQATKKALLVGVVALMLCLAMLTGTTFAWFTDQETSGNNHIIAGNLDVKLLHTNDVDVDEEVGQTTKLFDSITLWEPGAVVWENLTVENAGNLSLKYLLNVVMSNQVPDGTVNLSDVLYVEFVTDANGDPAAFSGNRADAIALFDDDSKKLTDFVNDYAATGELAPKAEGATENPSDTHGIVIYWKPSDNDNLYNMNNGKNKELSLEIGVILNVTQLAAEKDAFGDDYDEGLQPPNANGLVLESFADGSDYYRTDAGLVLYDTQDVVATDYVVPAGISVLGDYSLSNNANIKTVTTASTVTSLGRAFDSSSSIKRVVLNEGLEQIDSRAFRSTTALEEVVIPSTVKTIADNSFQKSGIKEIVIPATVETIGETAFGSSKIEKVTIEGNTSIQGYAFRGCTALRKVYLNGDDVTFIPSTLNGRNSTWFCNGESNNPNTSNITFHVVNETVAKRVKTAMGADKEKVEIYVNDVLYTG